MIDAWSNAFTGFHAIGAKLVDAGAVDVAEEVNALIYHLTDLDVKDPLHAAQRPGSARRYRSAGL